MKRDEAITGILLAAGGIAMLCAMDAVAKSLGAHISTFQISFVRYAGAALWLAAFMLVARAAWPRRENYGRHALRGALIVVTACLFFYGVTNLPLAVAAALGMTAPIYISLLGVVFLKEPVSPGLLLAIALGVAGSLIIVFGGEPVPTGGSSSLLAWGAGILAPVSYAVALVLMKHHASDEEPMAMTLAQSSVAAVIAIPLALPGLAAPPAAIWWQLALIGLLGAVGFILIFGGLKRLPASIFSVVDYTGLLWAAGFGYLFFSEVPQAQLWIGGVLIIAACALGMRAAGRRKPVAPEPTTAIPPAALPSSAREPRSSSES